MVVQGRSTKSSSSKSSSSKNTSYAVSKSGMKVAPGSSAYDRVVSQGGAKVTLDNGDGGYVRKNSDGSTTSYNSSYGSGSGGSGGGSYGYDYDFMDEYKRALGAAQDSAAEAYRKQIEAGVNQINAQRDPLKQQYNDAAQQEYIANMQSKKSLPDQLAAQGLGTDGLAESSNIALDTQYGNNLNNLTRDYNNSLTSLDSDISQLQATGDMQIAQNASQYQQQLAAAILAQQQQQAQFAQQMQLAKYNNEQARQMAEYNNSLAMQRDAAQAALSAGAKSSLGSSSYKPNLTYSQAQSAINNGDYSDEIANAYQYYTGTRPSLTISPDTADQLSRWWSANDSGTFNSLVQRELSAGRLTQAELAAWLQSRGMS
ncbi:hypothetical protein [Marasmitruncus massiliensis]|uniref:hypothetical protein n=1 Tax=Marasmitruncus massiliensis TaxID=1944642 RepID=UPI000C79A2ED|nr:hypothetical protein [Marasmitruncus massiliensis]